MYFYIIDSTSKDEGILNSRRNKFEQLINKASVGGPIHYATGDSDFNLLIDMALGEKRKTLVVIGDDNTYTKVASVLVKLKTPPALGFLPLTRYSFFAQRLYGSYTDYDLLPILGRRSISSANCLFVNQQVCFDTTTVTNPGSIDADNQATMKGDSFSINVSKFTTIKFRNPFLNSTELVEVAIELSGTKPNLTRKNSDRPSLLNKIFSAPGPTDSRVFLNKASLSMSSPCQVRIDADAAFSSKRLKLRLSKRSLLVITANKDK